MLSETTRDTDKVAEEQAVYGTDTSEIFADRSIKDKNIEYNGKIWKFKYRELTWAQIGRITSKATKTMDVGGDVQVTFDIEEYSRQYMLETIVEAPFPMNQASFLKLSVDFGRLLSDAFVEMPALSEPESKNSSEPLTVEGPTTQPQK